MYNNIINTGVSLCHTTKVYNMVEMPHNISNTGFVDP